MSEVKEMKPMFAETDGIVDVILQRLTGQFCLPRRPGFKPRVRIVRAGIPGPAHVPHPR